MAQRPRVPCPPWCPPAPRPLPLLASGPSLRVSRTDPTAGKRSGPHAPESLKNPLNHPNSRVFQPMEQGPRCHLPSSPEGVVPCPEPAPSPSQHPPPPGALIPTKGTGGTLSLRREQGGQSQPGAPHATGPDRGDGTRRPKKRSGLTWATGSLPGRSLETGLRARHPKGGAWRLCL